MYGTIVTDSVARAAEVLRAGGTVAFPTETVYGLGADAFNSGAVRKVFHAKGRPADNPVIVHVADISAARRIASDFPPIAERLLERFAPGPITVVVPRNEKLPLEVTAGLDTVAIRIPSHATALELLEAFGGAIAAPSANVSGRPSPTSWEAALADLDGRIDCVLTGIPSELGLESTVVDCRGQTPRILRPGAVSAEEIAKVAKVDIESIAQERSDAAVSDARRASRSPGLRHRHYAPEARVHIVGAATGTADSPQVSGHPKQKRAFIGLASPAETARYELLLRCADVDEYAQRLYAFFRHCEEHDIDVIECEEVPETGIGRALMDRLRRASAPETDEFG